VYELLIRKNMTVKDLKKRLKNLDDDQMVIITDGKGWCKIEKIEVKGEEVHIVQETEPIFSD
jgi:hypothetical protein